MLFVFCCLLCSLLCVVCCLLFVILVVVLVAAAASSIGVGGLSRFLAIVLISVIAIVASAY